MVHKKCGNYTQLLWLLPACLIVSCGTVPPDSRGDRGVDTTAGEQLDPNSLVGQGRFEDAALLWQQQAIGSDSATAASLRVLAADAWLMANRPQAARDLLLWVDRPLLTASQAARLDLVLADLALRDQRVTEAGLFLQRAAQNLIPDIGPRYDALDSRLRAAMRHPASPAMAEALRIADSMPIYEHLKGLALLKALEVVHSRDLSIRSFNPKGNQRHTGWIDLALVIRQNIVQGFGVDRAIAAWKLRHPAHPVSRDAALDLWLLYRQQFSAPSKVAVLLPTEGRLRAAGSAIRDGLISAYLTRPGGTELVFYPTDDDPSSSVAAYFQAVDEGAKLVIGPLPADSVEAVLDLAGLGTPLLALNRLPEQTVLPADLAGQVYGLSLSQEEEAAATGRLLAGRGLNRALLLAPDTDWGSRMSRAFSEAYLGETQAQVQANPSDPRLSTTSRPSQHTRIVAAVSYSETEKDYGPVLEGLLLIDESKARKASVERTLQHPLTFEPTRRDDIDVIYMAATASQARLLRPQLRFHEAGDIPVFATGRIYNGIPDRTRNRDLNGVQLPISPWLLAHTRSDELPALDSIRGGAFAALYALGRDSWDILPWLVLMQRDPDFRFPGGTGDLFIGADGSDNIRLMREPAWAKFRGGRPVNSEPDQGL